MHFPNWDTYSFFQQQSDLGLFLQVWEEVSAIIIGYLRNSASSPFLKMLALFARKEYQADVVNLSHIRLLGKNFNFMNSHKQNCFI